MSGERGLFFCLLLFFLSFFENADLLLDARVFTFVIVAGSGGYLP